MNSDELLTPKEAAGILKLATGTLANWRAVTPQLLPFVKIGRMVRYRRRDVEKLAQGAVPPGGRAR